MNVVEFLDGDGRWPNFDIHQNASTPDELRDLFRRDWMAFYDKFDILEDVLNFAKLYRLGDRSREERWNTFLTMVELLYLSKVPRKARYKEFDRLSKPEESPFFPGYRDEINKLFT